VLTLRQKQTKQQSHSNPHNVSTNKKKKNTRIRLRPKIKRKQLLLKFSLYVCANVATKNDRLVLFGMDGAGVALARDNTKTSLGTSPF